MGRPPGCCGSVGWARPRARRGAAPAPAVTTPSDAWEPNPVLPSTPWAPRWRCVFRRRMRGCGPRVDGGGGHPGGKGRSRRRRVRGLRVHGSGLCGCRRHPGSPLGRCHATRSQALADRLETHSAPWHGRWLNMAEIALSVLQQQCLDRRLGNRATMEQDVAAWVAARNETATSIDRRFTTSDARIKRKRLYPVIQA